MRHHKTLLAQSEPRHLSPRELAKRWGISTITLRRWRKTGRLRALKLGHCVRFSLEEIVRVEAEALV
jgi:excisionase family DNA binding protein